jgi:hypothetical protein
MTEPRITFLADDGTTGPRLTMRPVNGGYQLPRIVVSAERQIGVESAQIVQCTTDPPDAALERAITAEWQSLGLTGYDHLLRSKASWLPAEKVRKDCTVTVHWQLTYLEGNLYDRYVNSTQPSEVEARVELEFVAARSATGDVGAGTVAADSAGRRSPDEKLHLGHIAVDFGTSNTTVTLFDKQELSRAHLSVHQTNRLRQEVGRLLKEGDALGGPLAGEWQGIVRDIAATLLPGNDAKEQTDDELRSKLIRTLTNDDPERPRLLYPLLLELERRTNRCMAGLRTWFACAVDGAYQSAWRVPPLDVLRLFPVDLDRNEGAIIDSTATVTDRDPLRVRVGGVMASLARAGVAEDDGDPAQNSTDTGDAQPQGAAGTTDSAESATHGRTPLIYAGLKQRLARPEVLAGLGPGLTSDDLIREALRDLLVRTNAYIDSRPAGVDDGRIDKVVITYPTMATPPVRRKLREFLTDLGISQVDTSYDEAIAAAMFFVLRDFSGDHDLGLEVLRSRSTEIDGDNWRQNLLVIDIGGGTTDIALLTLGLQDRTPSDIREDARNGRYYELRPEVRGSTGKTQLGGELTTLRVFYWLKAVLADLLVAEHPARFRIQHEQLLHVRGKSASEGGGTFLERAGRRLPEYLTAGSAADTSEHDILDAVVPTRSPGSSRQPTDAFWHLWTLAEQVKREFLAGSDQPSITVNPARMRAVLAALNGPDGAPMPRIPREKLAISLSVRDFEELVGDDVDEVMSLARALVTSRLRHHSPAAQTASGDPGERAASSGTPGERTGTRAETDVLHRIVLVGQASQGWLVRQRLVEAFADAADDIGVRWKPSSVVVEREYGKQATSLGACWVRANRATTPQPEGARDRLRSGRNQLYIDVRNLLFNLPCEFHQSRTLGGGEDTELILPVGAELYCLEGSGPGSDVAVVRSKQFALTDEVSVYRDTFAGGRLPRWGEFQWKNVDPDRDETVWPNEITYQVEVTADLQPFILLYRGDRPHYDVSGVQPVSVLAAAAKAGAPSAPGSAGMSRPLLAPGAVVVNTYSSSGDHDGTPVFVATTATVPSDTASAQSVPPAASGTSDEEPVGPHIWPEVFHDGDRQVRGVTARFTAPPTQGGFWSFHYLDANGKAHGIGDVTAPKRAPGDTRPIRSWVSLTEDGELRVHLGEIPFWAAEDLAEVELHRGRVHRATMEITDEEYRAGRDPFNGRH